MQQSPRRRLFERQVVEYLDDDDAERKGFDKLHGVDILRSNGVDLS